MTHGTCGSGRTGKILRDGNSTATSGGDIVDRRTCLRPLATSKAALGLKDDVAILGEIVLTTDTIIAGVDFFPNDPPDTIARKALRVNLSDLAAKGARPFGYLLTLTLPQNTREAWLRDFAKGLRDDQKEFGLTLLGGRRCFTAVLGDFQREALKAARRSSASRDRRASASQR